jgi:hypothetical protein
MRVFFWFIGNALGLCLNASLTVLCDVHMVVSAICGIVVAIII